MIEFERTSKQKMILHNEIRRILSLTIKRNLLKLYHDYSVTSLNKHIIFLILIYKINLLCNQDIYLIKHSCILINNNLHSQAFGSGINTCLLLDFSPLYFLAKEK